MDVISAQRGLGCFVPEMKTLELIEYPKVSSFKSLFRLLSEALCPYTQ